MTTVARTTCMMTTSVLTMPMSSMMSAMSEAPAGLAMSMPSLRPYPKALDSMRPVMRQLAV